MRYIKNHLMFILSLMAILLGIEFFMVFDRTTDSYEKGLKEGYSMLVVSDAKVDITRFRTLNRHIAESTPVDREEIVLQIAQDISKGSRERLIGTMPYFYTLHLDSYMDVEGLEKVKTDLLKDIDIIRVETFGNYFVSSYRLFAFIQFVLKVFIAFLAIVSFFLIIKQMEIWKYAHRERMQIMEIFGAPLMLRSGVLFKVALLDAVISLVVVSSLFAYLKFEWAMRSGIEMMVKNYDDLFLLTDIIVLFLSAIVIVIISVYWVVFSSKGVTE